MSLVSVVLVRVPQDVPTPGPRTRTQELPVPPSERPPPTAAPIHGGVRPALRPAYGWLSHDWGGIWELDPSSSCQWRMAEQRSQVCKLGEGRPRGAQRGMVRSWCAAAAGAGPGVWIWGPGCMPFSEQTTPCPQAPGFTAGSELVPTPSALCVLLGRWPGPCAAPSPLWLTPHLPLPFQLSQQIS